MSFKKRISKKILFSFMLGIAMVQTTTIICADIFQAIASNDFNSVQTLLMNNKNNLTITDHNGYYPIHVATDAAFNGKMLQLLLDHGANINQESKDHKATPLHIAVLYKSPPVTKWLIEHNAFVDSTDANGRTPLHYAFMQDNTAKFPDRKHAKLLLMHGADPDAEDDSGILPAPDKPHFRINPRNVLTALIEEIERENDAKEIPEALALALFITEGRREALLAATTAQLLDNQLLTTSSTDLPIPYQ